MRGLNGWAPFLALETATLLSGSANGIAMVALPWLILELTGSASAAGTMAALVAVPTMASALLSGTIVDYVGRKAVSVVSDLASLISVAMVPILDHTLGLTYGAVVVIAIAGAVFDPAGMGAREAMLPETAERARLPLPTANGVHEAVWGVAFMLGPGLGGLLIATVGSATTFWAAAVMFAVSIAVIAPVRIPGGSRPARDQRPDGFWSGTAEGLRFLWHDRLLRAMSLLMMALAATYLPVEGVLLPFYFEEQNRPGAFGAVIMAMSAGGIVGALSYGWLARRFTSRAIYVGGFVAVAVVFAPFALLPALPVMLPLAFLLGVVSGPINPVLNVEMQTRTPTRLRGRVVGVITAIAYAAGPLGYLLAGPIIDSAGIEVAMLAFAAAFALLAMIAMLVPALREGDRVHPGVRPGVEEAPPPRPG